MGSGNVRKGITQARFNEEQINIFIGEVWIISCFIGYVYKSWYVFGSVFFGLMFTIYIPYLNILLALALSLIWGFLGYEIGKLISHQAANVIGIFALLGGLGSHLGAIEWARDVSDTNDRNFS